MGLFGSIVDSFKDSLSSIADTAVNLLGNITDSFKPERPHHIDRPQKEVSPQYFEFDELYDDYTDWINEIWY